MADVTSAAAEKQRPGVPHGKKLSTKVDLTPMVDLGFLLITFFIMTTKLSEPKKMTVIMPKDDINSPTPIGESTSLTVIPYGNNKIFYYHGELPDALLKGNYGNTGYSLKNGIGDIIRKKQIALDKHPKFSKKDLMLIIMPEANSNCQNFVDLLDEVQINDVKHYALVDTNEKLIGALSDKLK
jgi:biopolymer transport protein ExbD